MRKRCALFTLLVCAIIGALHLLDLAVFTDLNTGFVSAGSVYTRYAVLFVGVLLCLVPLIYTNGTVRAPNMGKAYFACLAVCGVISEIFGFFNILTFIFKSAKVLTLAHGVMFVLFGVFYFMAALHIGTIGKARISVIYVGLAGNIALYLLTIERFIGRTSSLHRFAPTLGILSALAALVYATQLIKSVGLFGDRRPFKALAATGQVCFLLCTCMEMPHSIYLFCVGLAPMQDVMLCLLLGVLGILGALCAIGVAEA